MSVQITIRGVPDSVRDQLASQAASQGRSMQEYLRGELVRLAAKPTMADLLKRIKERKSLAPTNLSVQEILEHRDADRR